MKEENSTHNQVTEDAEGSEEISPHIGSEYHSSDAKNDVGCDPITSQRDTYSVWSDP